MGDDDDIQRIARQMIQEHGSEAELTAAQEGDRLLAQGDGEGFRKWLRIVACIVALQRNNN